MAKFSRVCKVTVVVRGCHAGKKVVIVKPRDEGPKNHSFLHALVAGIEITQLEDYWRARSEEDCHEDLNLGYSARSSTTTTCFQPDTLWTLRPSKGPRRSSERPLGRDTKPVRTSDFSPS